MVHAAATSAPASSTASRLRGLRSGDGGGGNNQEKSKKYQKKMQNITIRDLSARRTFLRVYIWLILSFVLRTNDVSRLV